jgi:rhamnose utilization protein RhaD (predicted bifunctional aldolase and dehydrogenase)
MRENTSATNRAELTPLRELSARIGSDPLLTQASTGNISIKLEGVLWIKASDKWMADAIHDDILIPLDLAEVKECVKQDVDPAVRYTRASSENRLAASNLNSVDRPLCCSSLSSGGLREAVSKILERFDRNN